ncbi:MAG: nucleotide exchange factor GrpE [Coriobacteriales bacterium]|jgi:molecular chaperone GrpE|nr:nucleotide exchange factor GrpE [Coriobacteriales bacterium]
MSSKSPASSTSDIAPEPDAQAAGPTSELEEQISEDLGELDELAEAKAEADVIRERYLRLKAEWDNYRKRTEAERAEERSRATQHLVERLLPLIDDLERAVEHSATASAESLKEGIVLLSNKLGEVLEHEGLKAIDPKGERFDAHLHSAISKQEDASVNEDTVLEVFQKGYELGSRVLRPAMVVVSSGGPSFDHKIDK